MTTEREVCLRNLRPGDIFHGVNEAGASLICLVTHVGETVIEARTVTTQIQLSFDRQNGQGESDSYGICIIDSIVPLPVDVHNVMLGLDRKYRLERKLERMKLNDAEKKGLLFIDTYYAANQI